MIKDQTARKPGCTAKSSLLPDVMLKPYQIIKHLLHLTFHYSPTLLFQQIMSKQDKFVKVTSLNTHQGLCPHHSLKKVIEV